MIQETQLIWEAAGKGSPSDTTGTVIDPKYSSSSHCARCNSSEGVYDIKQVLSENFTRVRNANRLQAYGGTRYCPACTFCARTLRLRCKPWFASEAGVTWWRMRPLESGEDPLEGLLSPPEPPFVAGIPLYGVSHGGEANWERTWWPKEPVPDHPLIKLQSKHVALYSRVALSKDRYPVQVDDNQDFVLDRDTWLRLRDTTRSLLNVLASEGVHPYPVKLALEQMTPPRGSSKVSAVWRSRVKPLLPYYRANWWPLFCELACAPALREKFDEKA